MKTGFHDALKFLVFACLTALSPGRSCLAEFPEKPIKVIVPFAPGGDSDTFVRIVQSVVQKQSLLNQPLVVINVPGAGGTIGSRRVKDAEPDGYTVLNLHDGILSAKLTGQADYGYEAFEPIAATGRAASMVCVSYSSEWKTLKQLLQAAKDAPDTIKFGANLGALSHFGALQLEQAFSGAAFRYVPAGGGAKRFGDLIGDHIDVSVFNVGEYVNFKDGGLRALAILSNERDPAFPDVPTAREQGIDAVRDSMQYWWAPKKTSPDRVAYLVNLLREVMLSEAMQAKLAEMHVEPVFVTGPELRHTLRKRELVMQGVQMKSSIPMPNTPLMAIVVTVLLGGLTAFRQRTATAILPASASPIDGPAGEQNERQPGTQYSRSPVIALAALLGFCLLFSLEVLPFWLLSGTFVIGLGLLLMPRNAKTMATLFAIAVVVGPGCYLLFTKVLTIDLP